MRTLTEKQLKDMTAPTGVMEAFQQGNKKPYEEYYDRVKPIADKFSINLNKAANKLDQSNNWLVWATMLLAATEIIISFI